MRRHRSALTLARESIGTDVFRYQDYVGVSPLNALTNS
jgi:hypothetical protein